MTVVQIRRLKLQLGDCEEKSAVCDVGALPESYPRKAAPRLPASRLRADHLCGTSWAAAARPTLVSPIRNDKQMADGGSIAALQLFLLSQRLQSAAVKRKYGPIAGSAAQRPGAVQDGPARRGCRYRQQRDLYVVRGPDRNQEAKRRHQQDQTLVTSLLSLHQRFSNCSSRRWNQFHLPVGEVFVSGEAPLHLLWLTSEVLILT